MTSPAGQCTALNVSDEKRCQETATSINGLFCAFHSKQCQGLYRGYKRRNAHLDKLDASPPPYLATSKTPLTNQLFADVDSEDVCQAIHDHLFRKLQLLERVIRARKLHHSRFFSMNYDYGHQKYLDHLHNQRATVTKALERIERRTAEILYKNRKWFKWVRQCQDDDEANREKEQKKVKLEAAMFKRHWKEVQQRMNELRAKEDQKKQDAFLEQAYKERLEQQGDDDDGIDWDPIEDVLEDNRGNFVDLIKAFLWMVEPESASQREAKRDVKENGEKVDNKKSKDDNAVSGSDKGPTLSEPKPAMVEDAEAAEGKEIGNSDETKVPASSKKSKNSKKKKKKASNGAQAMAASVLSDANVVDVSTGVNRLALAESSKASMNKKTVNKQTPAQQADKNFIETRVEMYDRLKHGSEYNDDEVVGLMVAGTVENPVVSTKTITFPDEEIERLLGEVSEIKHLLFCRLLLGHAALLPAALRADSVQAFLDDPDVTESDLRDLCLKMEQPGLQEIRDACADLFRSEDEEENVIATNNKDESNNDESELEDELKWKPRKPKGALPEKWVSKREKARAKGGDMVNLDQMLGGDSGTAVDFGEIKDDGKFQKKAIRVKLCGRTIWNYPSSKAMSRKGWLHFCIIAKDSSLYDAIALCRHWDEFFELNILAIWHYFPGANWANWVGSRYKQQLLQLGFIVYYESVEPDAYTLTHHQQSGRRGQFQRSHAVFEARNFMCAHIKRDDPASRRLIQYLSMQTQRLLVLVRDAESGRLLIKPPEEQRWLMREKSGRGRASKGQWNVVKRVGPQLFEEMDHYRKWSFSFKEFYDIYVWDLEVGEPFPLLYNAVQQMLIKALRCCSGADLYNPAAPVLKTLTRDKDSHLVRDIKPEDEGVTSIYDDIHHKDARFFIGEIEYNRSQRMNGPQHFPEESKIPRGLFYNEADAVEDEILFPEERSTEMVVRPSDLSKVSPLETWVESGFDMRKWVEGWDSDSDVDSRFGSNSEFDEDDEDDQDDDYNEDEDIEDEGDHDLDDPELPDVVRDVLQKWMSSAVARRPESPDMEKEFLEYLDKTKARKFKEAWHEADLEPHAQMHYVEMMEMTKKSLRFNRRNLRNPASVLTFTLIAWLENIVDIDDAKDVYKAVAKIFPFFSSDFLESEDGQSFKESLLFNQAERAQHLPDVRSSTGNLRRQKDFWVELDSMKPNDRESFLDDAPLEWDTTIRPIIARLYKAGIIRNRADQFFAGQAIAAKEPHRTSRDLFIDWRRTMTDLRMPAIMQDPYSIPSLRTTARNFSTKHPNARFAILRLWSAPHFYPLMIGPDNHDRTSFRDLIGRTFIWMFVPKDMPNSEWSMHHASRQLLTSFTKLFGNKVVVKRNVFLVMGTDEEDLKKFATATAYAIQRRPWRWEVDLWKSFVNVDFGFLDGLQDEWLE